MQAAIRALGLGALLATLFVAKDALAASTNACSDPQKTVYLTFDTGHMRVAPLVAEVLARQRVLATFFVANEGTQVQGDTANGGSLDDTWAPWWKARAAEGHAFGSHTWSHAYWQRDLPKGGFAIKPSAGPTHGRAAQVSADQYCAEIRRPLDRLQQIDPAIKPLPLFRAPGGKTSPALLKTIQGCGFQHVGWSAAGFLGDELPSDAFPNAALLAKALQNVKGGDILLAHLGIWSRKDPWAPTVLEPLLVGLKARGLCFATLRDHPMYSKGHLP